MKLNPLLANIQAILLISIVVTLPFFTVFNSFFIILITINSIALRLTCPENFKTSKQVSLQILLFASLFFLYLFTLLISSQYGYWYILEKKFSVLAFPLALGIATHKLKPKIFNLILIAFVTSTLIAVLITFAGNLSLLKGIRPEDDIDSFLIFRRPYFGLYSLFSVFILGYLFINLSNWRLKILLVILAIFFLYFTYLIYAKMAILSFVITVFWLFVAMFLSTRRFTRLKWFLISIPIGFLLVFALTPGLQIILVKIIHFEPFDFSNYKWIYFLSLNMRFAIWDCTWSILSQGSNWFWGCGLDHQYLLDQCYYSSDAVWIKYGILPNLQNHFPYNAHNEYLHVWLDTGIIGLLILLSIIVISLRIAIKRDNFLYFSFLVFFFLCCITESMFSVQKGIVFYAFFNSLFAFSQPKNLIKK